MPLSKVRLPDRHPYEVYLLAAAGMFGAGDLLDIFPTPASVTAEVPISWLWAWMLLVGCLLGLAAFSWPRRPGRFNLTPLQVEQVGLVSAGAAAGFYALVLWINAGAAGAYTILMNGGFCLASIAQAFIIQRFIRQIREALALAAKIAAEQALRAEFDGEGGP